MRTRVVFLAAALLPAAVPAGAQERHEHPDCPDPGTAFWTYRIMHWHYPGVVAELTQRNGRRSEADLDAVARDLVRSAVSPDGDAVAEHVRTHFEGDIRAGAEEAAADGICYDERDVDWMVADAIEDERRDPDETARMMAAQTLRLAAHQGGDSSLDPPHGGIPYAGAFEATVLLYEEVGRVDFRASKDAGRLLEDIDEERAAVVFEQAAMTSGALSCAGQRDLRWWDAEGPHPSYERLRRRGFPERCPELDNPGSGG
ncbi:hypothetical protein [Candidatus Palauibacter sp.]|uniref:hypothetical protein n=1 Tax=Candidatus Palauibacter sp. TaxID=3101350 RepID=UPI003B5AC6AA